MNPKSDELAREKAIEVIFGMPYNQKHLPNKDYVKFLKKLNSLHFALKARLRGGVRAPQISRDAALKSLLDGIPLLSGRDLHLPPDILAEGAGEIIAVMRDAGLADSEALNRLSDSLRDGEPKPAEIVKCVLRRNENYFETLEDEFDVPAAVLTLFAVRLAAPLVELYAEPLAPLLADNPWRRGYCPICGAWAALSVYSQEEGKRQLVCGVCRTMWPFQRVNCPFCVESGEQKTAFLYADDVENPYRVDVCNACKRAIKAVDLRKWNPPEVAGNVAEHIAVYYLDLLAEKKGYRT